MTVLAVPVSMPRGLYSGAALAVAVLVFAGFARSYYLRGFFLHVRAVTMAAAAAAVLAVNLLTQLAQVGD
ncbi:MAG TPA: hypothetical protein VGR80_09620 [Steroidobacteraceae bacterium]|nr:hypothetical protein [Steroidobacteraceae bacterium]